MSNWFCNVRDENGDVHSFRCEASDERHARGEAVGAAVARWGRCEAAQVVFVSESRESGWVAGWAD